MLNLRALNRICKASDIYCSDRNINRTLYGFISCTSTKHVSGLRLVPVSGSELVWFGSRTAEQLESSIRQQWDLMPLPEAQRLVCSVPDVYRCWGCCTVGNMDALQPWNSKWADIYPEIGLCFLSFVNQMLVWETLNEWLSAIYLHFGQFGLYFWLILVVISESLWPKL